MIKFKANLLSVKDKSFISKDNQKIDYRFGNFLIDNEIVKISIDSKTVIPQNFNKEYNIECLVSAGKYNEMKLKVISIY